MGSTRFHSVGSTPVRATMFHSRWPVPAADPLTRFGSAPVAALGAPTSAERLFCHVYGRAKCTSQFILGWPYSFVAALESGRTSWTAVFDAVRLCPQGDATAVTADQHRPGQDTEPFPTCHRC